MWQLLDLPPSPAPVPLSVASLGVAVPGAIYRAAPRSSTISTAVLTEIAPGVYRVTVSAGRIDAVVVPGVGQFTFATNVGQPRSREFIRYSDELILYWDGNLHGVSVQIYSQPNVTTDYIQKPYPDWFETLPLEAEITWSESLEESPSGSMTLVIHGDTTPAKELLTSSGLLELWGRQFVVSSPKFTEWRTMTSPHLGAEVSCNLQGKWQWYSQQQVYWSGMPILEGQAGLIFGVTPQSPNAVHVSRPASVQVRHGIYQSVVRVHQSAIRVPSGPTGIYQQRVLAASSSANLQPLAPPPSQGDFVDLHDLLEQILVDVDAPPILIEKPQDVDRFDGPNWTEELQAFARRNGAIVDYSDPLAVRLRYLDQVNSWSYTENEIEGDVSLELPDVDRPPAVVEFGLRRNINQSPLPNEPTYPVHEIQEEDWSFYPTLEWRNAKLSGDFERYPNDDEQENTQGDGEPGTVVRPPEVVILTSGDIDPESPPGDPTHISCCFDLSGPQKTHIRSTIIDGRTVREEETVYGWAFLANSSGGSWQRISENRTIHRVQSHYEIGFRSEGWKLMRFKTEDVTDPESFSMDSGDPEFQLYEFFRQRVIGGKKILLKQFRDYFDWDNFEPAHTIEQRPGPDGRSYPVAVFDPDWVEPMFVAGEVEYNNSVARREVDEGEDQPTEYITGEETQVYRLTHVISEEFHRIYNSAFRGQDSDFRNSLWITTYQDSAGLPPEGSRVQRQRDTIDVATADQGSQGDDSREIAWYVRSLGYVGPPLDSLAVGAARTAAEVKKLAETELILKNWNEGPKESLSIPYNSQIRPGDEFVYTYGGRVRRRRVLGASHKIVLQQGLCTGMTELSLAVDRSIGELEIVGDRAPSPAIEEKIDPVTGLTILAAPYFVGRTIGELSAPPVSFSRRSKEEEDGF